MIGTPEPETHPDPSGPQVTESDTPPEIPNDGRPHIPVNVPGFNALAARKQANGKVLRNPNDRTHDHAEIRDVNHVAQYAAHVALTLVSQVNDGMFDFYQTQLAALASNIAIAIKLSIDEYDRRKRERVWHRRLRRQIRAWLRRARGEPELPPAPTLTIVEPSIPNATPLTQMPAEKL